MANSSDAPDTKGSGDRTAAGLASIRTRLKQIREELAHRRLSADESRRKLEEAEHAFSQAQTDVRSAEEARVRHRDAKHGAPPAKPGKK